MRPERCDSTAAYGQLSCELRRGHDDWHMTFDYDDDTHQQFVSSEWADEDSDQVVCGDCGRAADEHGDSDAGPMSVCPTPVPGRGGEA